MTDATKMFKDHLERAEAEAYWKVYTFLEDKREEWLGRKIIAEENLLRAYSECYAPAEIQKFGSILQEATMCIKVLEGMMVSGMTYKGEHHGRNDTTDP